VAIINYAMCLEGLLLEHSDKDNVTARLSEAVAYRLGRSAEDRDRLRKLTRQALQVLGLTTCTQERFNRT